MSLQATTRYSIKCLAIRRLTTRHLAISRLVCLGVVYMSLFALLNIISLTPAIAQTLAPSVTRARLYQALQEGGLVIYFRHGRTDRGGVDKIEWPREQQRLLSDEGQAQARLIGQAFKQHHFAVGEVLSSPFARCHDMALIAFGRTQDDYQLLGLLSEGNERNQRAAFSHELVRRSVPLGENRIIVGHSSNIRESTGQSIAEGEAVIGRPTSQGFELMAVLRPEDWGELN